MQVGAILKLSAGCFRKIKNFDTFMLCQIVIGPQDPNSKF